MNDPARSPGPVTRPGHPGAPRGCGERGAALRLGPRAPRPTLPAALLVNLKFVLQVPRPDGRPAAAARVLSESTRLDDSEWSQPGSSPGMS